jgi:hypothetical protein
MANGRFDFFGIYDWVLRRTVRGGTGVAALPSRLPFIRPLSLNETISRAGVYAIGISGLCGLTYLFWYVSQSLHG